MDSKWKSHAMKFPSGSRLHVPRMARLRTGESPGDSGSPPCPKMGFGRPMDCLGPLDLYQSLRHLVRYRFKPLSHGGGQWCSSDVNPSILQSPARCRMLDSHAFFLHPLNVTKDPGPLPLPAALQEPHDHIHNHTPEVTSIDVRPTRVHGSGAGGLLEIPRHAPGSGGTSYVSPDFPLT